MRGDQKRLDRLMSLGVWAWIDILKAEHLSISGQVALENLENDLKYFTQDEDKSK